MKAPRFAILSAAAPLVICLCCERPPAALPVDVTPKDAAAAHQDAGADGNRSDGAHGDRAHGDGAHGDGAPADARGADVPRVDASRADGPGPDLVVRADASHHDGSADGDGATAPAHELVGAPLVFAPTAHGFGVSVALRAGDPTTLELRVGDAELGSWTVQGPPLAPAPDLAQWTVDGLSAGRRYTYEVSVRADAGAELVLYTGSAATTPPPGTPFTAALIADSHIEPRDPVPPGQTIGVDFYGEMEATLLTVSGAVRADNPDFLINLGDLLDYHIFGFNVPPPDASWARLGYLNYRRLLGDSIGNAAHFLTIGNWDGESGCNTADEIARSMSQRLLYAPGPGPATYPEGGSDNSDYYAFTWGDALFVVLNVMTYTPTCHLLGDGTGVADDWTLGSAQLAWLDQTLAGATAKWRFLFIHHTVGGAAGDPEDTAYGRGGGQAAYVGEQATIHAMMLKYGVQVFFYAHDHVFTDMVVDGIHYLLPGSAGAPWKFDATQTGYTHYWLDSGYARLKVAPDSAEVDLVSIDGETLEALTLN